MCKKNGAGDVGAIIRVYGGRWQSGGNYKSVGWALVKGGNYKNVGWALVHPYAHFV